jgi:hypothetical protein
LNYGIGDTLVSVVGALRAKSTQSRFESDLLRANAVITILRGDQARRAMTYHFEKRVDQYQSMDWRLGTAWCILIREVSIPCGCNAS